MRFCNEIVNKIGLKPKEALRELDAQLENLRELARAHNQIDVRRPPDIGELLRYTPFFKLPCYRIAPEGDDKRFLR